MKPLYLVINPVNHAMITVKNVRVLIVNVFHAKQINSYIQTINAILHAPLAILVKYRVEKEYVPYVILIAKGV